ncbi:hypothetical protein Syun_012446 [Stephania yunnanensis]|uniref:YqgF/RNase H-like domain-containing protein n=1 Tax=Stephania yunnanensis TaxID=152371 RepID=A0AAP0JZF5_9MAGN
MMMTTTSNISISPSTSALLTRGTPLHTLTITTTSTNNSSISQTTSAPNIITALSVKGTHISPCKCTSSGSRAEEEEIPPNAIRRKKNEGRVVGFSVGVDLGMSRTGVALSKGFFPRPLTILELRGQKLELRLLEIAEREEADEFIIGLPKSSDGKETPQSNVVRSFAGRLAARAAERGWRVYLQDEHGTSADALDFMINIGFKKSARQELNDAYAAMMVLERYFTSSGLGAEIVLPKQKELRDKLQRGAPKDLDFFADECDA